VFSISTAYNRREKALEEYANIKAHGRTLYLASRYWLSATDEARDSEIKEALRELLSACRDMVSRPLSEKNVHEPRVHAVFGRLSVFVQQMRDAGLSSSECSPLDQSISRIMVGFENIKHIYEYRTPRTLRAFSDFFILLLPILYGPYFAYQANEFSRELFFVM